MRILDRYIARQYLVNIVVLFFILFAVVVIADYALQFDEYTKLAARLDESGGGALLGVLRRGALSVLLVLDLWWPRLFQLYNYLLGLVLVGAMGFTLSQMVRSRELVAALAGGIGLRRIARPLVLVALVMLGLQLVNRELIVPRLAELLTREKWDAGRWSMKSGRLKVCADARGRLFYAASFHPGEGVLEGLYVWERDEHGTLKRRITADRATWDGTSWRLENGVSHQPAGERVQVEPVLSLDTDLDPTAMTLRRYEGYSQNLSTAQLGTLIERARLDGADDRRVAGLDRIRFGRIAGMAGNLLAVLVCLPFFLRREPTNMAMQAAYCAPVAILAVIGSTLGAAAAIPGLPEWLGVFVPAMVLVPLAVAALSSVRT